MPGDKIVGFVTRGFGVSVHKADCPNVSISRKNEDNISRWVNAEWDAPEEQANSQDTYEALLQIIIEDKIGVMADITLALANMKVSIKSINTQIRKNSEVAVNLVIGCKNTAHYQSIVSKIKCIPSVVSVTRGFTT